MRFHHYHYRREKEIDRRAGLETIHKEVDSLPFPRDVIVRAYGARVVSQIFLRAARVNIILSHNSPRRRDHERQLRDEILIPSSMISQREGGDKSLFNCKEPTTPEKEAASRRVPCLLQHSVRFIRARAQH